MGAYWFMASTSFANPAVTAARAFTDTFAGIRPADAPGFIATQFVGAGAATLPFGWLVPAPPCADAADSQSAGRLTTCPTLKGKLYE
jgi:glycerol uptake facilitator-like aquaporin